MKNNADALFFAQLFVSERKQIAFMADEKLHTQVSRRLFATSRSELRISVKINEIDNEFKTAEITSYETLFKKFESDERAGVIKVIQKYKNKLDGYHAELLRLEHMKVYEKEYGEMFSVICGIDEAGRGPLAGPVVAGAVILPKDKPILYLNDSKKLSAKKRDELYDVIIEQAVSYGVGIASPGRIDEINILNATYEAMRDAVSKLDPQPECLLNDAVIIPGINKEQVKIIKGDQKSVSIAAASIVAKVTRDRMMVEYDKIYPEYGFAKHKGYGSAQHIEAIKKYGPCPIHRSTFIGNFI